VGKETESNNPMISAENPKDGTYYGFMFEYANVSFGTETTQISGMNNFYKALKDPIDFFNIKESTTVSMEIELYRNHGEDFSEKMIVESLVIKYTDSDGNEVIEYPGA
jgi:hypothetical protein